jgi:putative MATE family efflux protein
MSRARLTTGSIPGHVRTMAVPMVWGILSVVVVNLTDTYFVGQLGTEPLAAMGFGFPVVMFVFSLGIGLSAGAGSVIARGLGSGDHERTKRLTTDGLVLSFLIAAALSALGLLTIDPVFRLLGADDAVMPHIRDYMVWWYIGAPCLIVSMVGNGAVRAGGDTKWPSIIMIASAVINAVLDPILIFGLFGAPRLEIAGAAIATTISRVITLGVMVWILHHREDLIAWTRMRLDAFVASARPILHVGGAAAVNQMLNPLAQAALVAFVAAYGAEAVAGYGVATKIEGFLLVVLYAVSSVVGPIAGQNLTAGHRDRVEEVFAVSLRFSLIFGALAALAMFALAETIAEAFNPDPAVTGVAVLYLFIVPWSYAGHGLVMNAVAWLNGLGKPGPSLGLTILRMAVLMVPLAFAGGLLFGPWGVFAGVALANAASGAAAVMAVRRIARTL